MSPAAIAKPLMASAIGDTCRLLVVALIAIGVIVWPVETVVRLSILLALLIIFRRLAVPEWLDAVTTVLLTSATVAGAVGAYRSTWWLDDVAHGVVVGFSSLAVAVAVRDVSVRRRGEALDGRLPLPPVTATLGLALASCWELYEWASTHTLGGGTIQVSYDDTMSDIALGGMGAVLVGFANAFAERRRPPRRRIARRAVGA